MSTTRLFYKKRIPANATEAARFEYQRQWYAARKHAGTPRGDAASQWLAARAAALRAKTRTPPRKKAAARRAARRQTRRLTRAEKDRLHELRRIRYSVDDDFRAKVNALNREYYKRNKAHILAIHRAYNSRPEVLARRREISRRPENKARARAARTARLAS